MNAPLQVFSGYVPEKRVYVLLYQLWFSQVKSVGGRVSEFPSTLVGYFFNYFHFPQANISLKKEGAPMLNYPEWRHSNTGGVLLVRSPGKKSPKKYDNVASTSND